MSIKYKLIYQQKKKKSPIKRLSKMLSKNEYGISITVRQREGIIATFSFLFVKA